MTAVRRLRAVPVAAVAIVVATVAAMAGPVGASNDTYFDRQWALTQIRAPEAWAKSTGFGVTIGIVDTGVDIGHPDLAGKVVATADCVGRPCAADGGQDTHGHGTIVSGIAAATTNNGKGIAGVAPDARLVVAKVLNSSGEGRLTDIENGIRWVVDHGAKVVNLSLGDPDLSVPGVPGTPLRSAVDYAWSKGAVPVLASGNYGASLGTENYGNLNALVVGATDRAGSVPAYSSAVGNAKWGLVAPGGGGAGAAGVDANVLSTFLVAAGGTGYASAAGTSMAAPHVSGAVALLLAQGLTPAAAVNRLLLTLDKSVPCGTGCQGRLDVAAAAGSVTPTPAPTTTAPPTASTVPRTTVPAPTTTQAPAPTSTSTSTTPTTPTPSTVPPALQSGGSSELAAPILSGPVPVGGATAGPNPAIVATAAVLVVAMAGAVGGVGWRRLSL